MGESLSLEERVRRLEDIEAIKNLTATCALYINKGWNGEEFNGEDLPALFAEDASWKNEHLEVHVQGREAIVAMLREASENAEFVMQSFANPVIDVTGDTAAGSWLLWAAVKVEGAVDELYQSAELDYARAADGWRITAVSLNYGASMNSQADPWPGA